MTSTKVRRVSPDEAKHYLEEYYQRIAAWNMIPKTRPAGRRSKIRDHANTNYKRCASVQLENAHRRRMSVDIGLLVAKGSSKVATQGSTLQHSLSYKDNERDNEYQPQMGPLSQKEPPLSQKGPTLLRKTLPVSITDDKLKGDDLCPLLSQHGTNPSTASSRQAPKRRAWSLIKKKSTGQKKGLHRSDTYHNDGHSPTGQ